MSSGQRATAPLRLIYVPPKLFVAGNASGTANNIAAHETLFRLGILSDLFTATMAIFLTPHAWSRDAQLLRLSGYERHWHNVAAN